MSPGSAHQAILSHFQRCRTTYLQYPAQWPVGYGVGLRIKRSSVRIRPSPLRWVLGQGSLLLLSQGEAFALASISYLAILVKYILAKKKKKKKKTHYVQWAFYCVQHYAICVSPGWLHEVQWVLCTAFFNHTYEWRVCLPVWGCVWRHNFPSHLASLRESHSYMLTRHFVTIVKPTAVFEPAPGSKIGLCVHNLRVEIFCE